MEHSGEFIMQTAIDYDMEFWEVEKIIDEYGDDLYTGLELFIKERAQQGETQQRQGN